jgi:hypothetical protein
VVEYKEKGIMRIFYDCLVVLICIFAPWWVSVFGLILGLIFFDTWFEGFVFAALLDVLLFGGSVGKHTIYVMLSFSALYYVTIRFRYMLHV